MPGYKDLEGKKRRVQPRTEPVYCHTCGTKIDPWEALRGRRGWRSAGKGTIPVLDESFDAIIHLERGKGADGSEV